MGWTNPVLVDERGVLIAGHGRVAAATRLGLKTIPVIVARGWSDEEKQAYRLADNELAVRATWHPGLLPSELHDLKFGGFDLELIGFEPDRLEDILAELGSSGQTDPDSTPEIPEDPVTRPGDIWGLGNHRVGCGDSTSAADVASPGSRSYSWAPSPVNLSDWVSEPSQRSRFPEQSSRFCGNSNLLG